MFRCLAFLLVLTVNGQTSTVEPTPTISNFLPFGRDYGDTALSRDLDAITAPIMISTRFPYFNEQYDEIKLSSHGLILFGNRSYIVPHASPGRFPIPEFVCVAPFWADTAISLDPASDILYREIDSTDTNTLLQISSMVRKGFPSLAIHPMLWAFVATWNRVPGHIGGSQRNTYQAILATNGLYSFVLFTYHQLEWSSGLWGGYPQVGFNAGDQVNYFTLDKSFSPDVIEIVNMSNIGVPGQYVFHTTGNISDVECETKGGLVSTPTRGSLYGGYELRLHGICFNETTYQVEIDGQILSDCHLYAPVYIICIMPMVFGGSITIRLITTSDNRLVGFTHFSTFVPEDNAELLLNNYAELTQITEAANDDHELTMRFHSNAITNKYLFNVIIYDYAAQQDENNGTFYNPIKRRVDLGLTHLNLSQMGNLKIRYDSIIPTVDEPEDRVHSLGINFEVVTATRKVAWIVPLVKWSIRIYKAQKMIRDNYCAVWLRFQPDASFYINQIPPCPCRVQTAWNNDFMGYTADPKCDGSKPSSETCSYHQGAKGCYRKKSDTTPAGAQCCYNTQGVWITDPEKGAGTLDAYMPTFVWHSPSTYMPTLAHYLSDVMSYESCCTRSKATSATCKAYHEKRPAGKCENIWPVPLGGNGDPHFSTLHGDSFTYNGFGEYTLLKVSSINLEVQVRLEPVSDLPTVGDKATAITAFAVKNRKQPRVQFELLRSLRLFEIRIDSHVLELDPFDEELSSFFNVIYTDDVSLTIRRTHTTTFLVSYSDNNVQFQVQLRPTFDFLDLFSIVPRSLLRTQTVGLLGDLESLKFPNGTRLSTIDSNDELAYTYGESWRTTRNTSLFYYLPTDSHEKHQDSTYRPLFHEELFQRYQNTSRFQLAQNTCGGAQTIAQRQCVYDVLITNDSSMSVMHQYFHNNLVEWEKFAELVEMDSQKSGSATLKNKFDRQIWYWYCGFILAVIMH